jgi:hypothetical protein
MKRMKEILQMLRDKATWVTVAGVAGMIVSALSASRSAHIFPPAYNVALASVGVILVTIDRIAVAIENSKWVGTTLEASTSSIDLHESVRVCQARLNDAIEREENAHQHQTT